MWRLILLVTALAFLLIFRRQIARSPKYFGTFSLALGMNYFALLVASKDKSFQDLPLGILLFLILFGFVLSFQVAKGVFGVIWPNSKSKDDDELQE